MSAAPEVTRDRVAEALLQLAPAERTLLALHLVDGCSIADVAAILGVPAPLARRMIEARLKAIATLLGVRPGARRARLRKAS
ncbi:MAG TPA: sigma factor-like helix-turn-helix DNA-binding protein [Candidatus Eisenbacteria bacterium]|nr:sigma factor-like helix-turn-helix DNA-binding protein [Candidatus Eisenbacteria bacterium]